ncbi:futalosine hydrolase [Streptomyces sp. NPDC020875]|uniref:futalosine hydrolase n=1 Tax=Streptomyces sp. NPDC020875 TaxID=3154898 RepID=UPI00340CEC6E
MRVLVVTAVAPEASAVVAGAGPGVEVLAGGVGPAAVAARTAVALSRAGATAAAGAPPYDLVVSAGIGGGFAPRAPVGSLVVADVIVAADLGAGTPDGGWLPLGELGFGRDRYESPREVAREVARLTGGLLAPVLTVSSVTGSAARAAELSGRHPGAGAEAMEGFGVAEAAAVFGLPVLEVRAVSNAVGPRDRGAWRIKDALAALEEGFRRLRPLFDGPAPALLSPAPGPLAQDGLSPAEES